MITIIPNIIAHKRISGANINRRKTPPTKKRPNITSFRLPSRQANQKPLQKKNPAAARPTAMNMDRNIPIPFLFAYPLSSLTKRSFLIILVISQHQNRKSNEVNSVLPNGCTRYCYSPAIHSISAFNLFLSISYDIKQNFSLLMTRIF